MGQKMRTKGFSTSEVTSLTQYIDEVLTTSRGWTKGEARREAWFRGQSQLSFALVPSAYRHDWDHESMFHYFKQMAGTLLDPRPLTAWEWYFAAQHFGIPTRLLDWTDDPIVALYFALQGNLPEEPEPKFDLADPPCVWVMDAAQLNQIGHGEYYVYVESEHTDSWSNQWLPQRIGAAGAEIHGHSTARPFAIQPARMTNRILAQRGVFTVHGKAKDGLESVFASSSDSQYLRRITIKEPSKTLEDIRDLGMSRFRLFPDCASLAEHIRCLFPPR
jgi:hypothetical protein